MLRPWKAALSKRLDSKHRTARARRRGFSLIEAMTSAGVLGVGLVGLVNLHESSMQGLSKGQQVAMAQEIATQQTDYLETAATSAGGSFEAVLPACPQAGPLGCLANATDFAPLKACTAFYEDPNVPGPSGASAAVVPSATAYRVDTVIVPHPDALNHPDALVLTVSVCWLDPAMKPHEIAVNRVIVPGV